MSARLRSSFSLPERDGWTEGQVVRGRAWGQRGGGVRKRASERGPAMGIRTRIQLDFLARGSLIVLCRSSLYRTRTCTQQANTHTDTQPLSLSLSLSISLSLRPSLDRALPNLFLSLFHSFSVSLFVSLSLLFPLFVSARYISRTRSLSLSLSLFLSSAARSTSFYPRQF
jgi:hypothetical protein